MRLPTDLLFFSETKCNFLHPPTSVYFLPFWFDFRCVFRFCGARGQYVSLCTAPARHKIWLAFHSICQLRIEKLSIFLLSYLCHFNRSSYLQVGCRVGGRDIVDTGVFSADYLISSWKPTSPTMPCVQARFLSFQRPSMTKNSCNLPDIMPSSDSFFPKVAGRH